jgi:nicotinamidase-related amidase
MANATPTPGKSLINPTNHTLIMVDHQPQMVFATQSIDPVQLRNNVALVAKSASGFGVSTLVTTVTEKSFSGAVFSEIRDVFPNADVIDRTNMNAWEDARVTDRINAIGKDRLVFAGLWTSVCIVAPVLSAIEQGFEVYVIADACGDVSDESHERAMQRMLQAGARPMTSLQYLLELQRDWATAGTYALTTGIARLHAGGYGLGIDYAESMFNGHEGGR